MQMCCKGALRLCHCKEKNDCQSAANIIDTAFNIFKARDNKVKESSEWKNAAKDMFKGKEDDEAREGKKAD